MKKKVFVYPCYLELWPVSVEDVIVTLKIFILLLGECIHFQGRKLGENDWLKIRKGSGI